MSMFIHTYHTIIYLFSFSVTQHNLSSDLDYLNHLHCLLDLCQNVHRHFDTVKVNIKYVQCVTTHIKYGHYYIHTLSVS